MKLTALHPQLIEASWPELVDQQQACAICRENGLLHEKAQPLFGRFNARKKSVLFVFEAPNLGDTEDSGKQYITYDKITDPTGKFTETLFREELGIGWEDFQVTNAVLCLPKRNEKGGHPVVTAQLRNCKNNLLHQIEVLDPEVVVSVGGIALDALRRIKPFERNPLKNMVARPLAWHDRWLFPLFHTSRLGQISRNAEEQRSDWRALAVFLVENDIKIKR